MTRLRIFQFIYFSDTLKEFDTFFIEKENPGDDAIINDAMENSSILLHSLPPTQLFSHAF